MSFWIVPSLIYSNLWFVFREDGTEIAVKTTHKSRNIVSESKLTDEELEALKKEHIKKPLKNLQSA